MLFTVKTFFFVPEKTTFLNIKKKIDEHLQVYLLAKVSKQITGSGDEVKEAINSFYNQLEVTVDATFLDTMTPNLNRSTSSVVAGGPTSPKIPSRRTLVETATPFFTQAYNRNSKNTDSILFEYEDNFCCLYPIVVPIGKCIYSVFFFLLYNSFFLF